MLLLPEGHYQDMVADVCGNMEPMPATHVLPQLATVQLASLAVTMQLDALNENGRMDRAKLQERLVMIGAVAMRAYLDIGNLPRT